MAHSTGNGRAKTTPRIFGLVRLFSDKEEDSAASQESEIREFAKRLDGEFVHCRVDDDSVVWAPKFQNRPEASKLLRECRWGDKVVAVKLDRISWSIRDALNTLEEFFRRGVAVYITGLPMVGGEPLDMASELGRFVLHMHKAFLAMEIGSKAQQMKARARYFKSKGLPYQGTRRLGYKRTWTQESNRGGERRVERYEPDFAERALVDEMYRRKKDGESIASIHRDLKRRGIKTAEGEDWGLMWLGDVLAWYGEHVEAGIDPWDTSRSKPVDHTMRNKLAS